MNKYIFSAGCVALSSLMLVSCNDYLKEDSGDLLIPGTVDEFSPMLYSEGYPSSFNSEVDWFVLMTDDVEMGHLEIDERDSELRDTRWDTFDSYKGGEGFQAYSWQQTVGLTDRFWSARYKNILACNTVIDALPTINDEGDTSKYNFLAAQAYALRAYHYWCLVNTYALPWSEANLDKPGVILRLTPQVDVAPKERATIGEVYAQINKDIAEAEKYIADSYFNENKHLLSAPAIYLLGTRIALSQEKWDEVIRLGNLYAENGGYYVYDLKNVSESSFSYDEDTSGFRIMNGKINNEILFTFGTGSSYFFNYNYLANSICKSSGLGFRPSRTGSNSLIGSYEEGDLRRKAWFAQDIPGKEPEWWWDDYVAAKYSYDYPVKYRSEYDSDAVKPSEKNYHENWRSVEVLLNVAEALARKSGSVNTEAVSLLNTLRKNRFDSSYTDLSAADFSTGDDLVKFIWAERRRELCFEEAMRFWDLKRQGMPQIEHHWYSSWDNYETYTLPQGSPNYLLTIPSDEITYNSACVNNYREIISPR